MATVKNIPGTKAPFPGRVVPMLSIKVAEPVDNPDYVYEIKWDGYRIIAFKKGKSIRLDTRSGLNYAAKYPLIREALANLKHDCVLDGEIVVFNEEGRPDFNAVQNYNGQRTSIQYYLFDVLWLNGMDLKELPLIERRKLLKKIIPKSKVLQVSELFDDGQALYEAMKERSWEGIVAKKKDSQYVENDRSMLWLKIPIKRIDEFVIGGYAESEKARAFRSILFGAYTEEGLKWVGRSGGGYKEQEMPGILKRLTPLKIDKSPFYNQVLDTKGARIHWLKPKLVAIFEYSEMTPSGRIRKPATWKGFRWDKDPKQVILPVEKQSPGEDVSAVPSAPKARQKRKAEKTTAARKPVYLNADSTWKKVDKEQQGAEWQEMTMENCAVKVHNVERELWTDVQKGKLILYYHAISKYILPHIADRPQSLNLKLSTAGGPTDFLKDMENRQPSCATIFTDERHDKALVEKGRKRDQIDYLIANNVETLLFMIDVGCVDINPWSSRKQAPREPDYLWIDLDPSIPKGLSKAQKSKAEEQGFQRAIETALATKEVLDNHKLKGFIKTSGKTGIHIYVPCRGFNNDQATRAATILATEVHKLVPGISTLQRSVAHRGDNVYIDPQQNYYTKTLAAPYSVRPYHEPLVSTPLDWKEVKQGLDRWAFNIDTIGKRLAKKGDLFKDVLSLAIARKNNPAIEKLLAADH